ncbi:hypothetical protein K438DRAFT_1753639 [Mycena galopus ATCC 62051]|nr:hypothetical protein K438DRAFT_1753639 [Mycena galopus ATCC 62051]
MSSFRIRKINTPVVFPAGVTTLEAHTIADVLIKAFSVGEGFIMKSSAKPDTRESAQSTDPYMAALTGYEMNTREFKLAIRLSCGSTTVGCLLGGEVYVAETTDAVPKIVGCAMWYPPGYEENDRPNEILAKVPYKHSVLSIYDHDVIAWLREYAKEYQDYFDSTLGKDWKRKSWSLKRIGVAPEYRRQGVGRLLVKTVLAKAALTGTPIVVECTSETTFQFYHNVGFKPMPIKGRDECRKEFTNHKGQKFSLRVLLLGETAGEV